MAALRPTRDSSSGKTSPRRRMEFLTWKLYRNYRINASLSISGKYSHLYELFHRLDQVSPRRSLPAPCSRKSAGPLPVTSKAILVPSLESVNFECPSSIHRSSSNSRLLSGEIRGWWIPGPLVQPIPGPFSGLPVPGQAWASYTRSGLATPALPSAAGAPGGWAAQAENRTWSPVRWIASAQPDNRACHP